MKMRYRAQKANGTFHIEAPDAGERCCGGRRHCPRRGPVIALGGAFSARACG